MGCLACLFCKKKNNLEDINEIKSRLINDDNENQNEKPEVLQKKKKMAIYLVENYHQRYKVFVSTIKGFNDEQINNLFMGNTNYDKYNSSNPTLFIDLVQKFEDYYEITSEWYDNENYYSIISELWNSNCVPKMKGKNDEEQDRILQRHEINMNNWDPAFRKHFKSVISQSLSKEQIAKRLKNYIEANYGAFDELIKANERCKQNVGEKEKSICGMYLKQNLDINMYKTIEIIFPLFLNKYKNDFNISSDFQKGQEDAAIKKMIDSGMSKTQSKKILEEIMKKYEEEKYTGNYEIKTELEKVKNLKFFKGKLDELGFKDKADIVLRNKMIKHAFLGISIMNLSYGILHLAQTFLDYDKLKVELRDRLDKIKKSFDQHKSQVRLIPNNPDDAAEYIKKLNADFNKDLEEVQKLIEDIQNAINHVKTERNKTIFQIFGSFFVAAGGIGAAILTKDTSDKIEYATSSIFDVLTSIMNAGDIVKAGKAIKEFEDMQKEAKKLREEIEKEIEDLRKKFDDLKIAHFAI